MNKFGNFFILTLLIGCREVSGKYMEGELITNSNWAFLARFCFLSLDGKFEYIIEFNEEIGHPNILLYYDTKDQWPAVYKKNKTCYQKESVLHVDQHQIINLTLPIDKYHDDDDGGCSPVKYITTTSSTTTAKAIISIPTRKPTSTTPATSTTTAIDTESNTAGETYTSTKRATASFNDDQGDNTSSPTKAPIQKRHVSYQSPEKNRNILCQNARRFETARERWWFVAISNCNSTKGIRIKYKILMTNGNPGDYFYEHFSADQFYILPILITFSITYSMIILAILVCTVELKSRQLLHTTYKLFVLSVIVQFFGIVLQTASYLKFAMNGVGAQTANTFGGMFMGCSETCFLLLLLLLAKGYTVTRGRLRLGASVKLTIFMCLYSVTYICIFIYEAQVFDPGEVLYLYESPAGYGLIVLRLIAWLMFVYSTVFTLKHYPEKGLFYYPFAICGTMWFIAGPAFIISANCLIDKWVRESVVCGVLLLISFGGHLMFLILTLPSMANKNFPYHVRTTQIGIMELTGTAGVSTIERFGHHVYEPTTEVNEERVIIPLTRRTEEIFGGVYRQPFVANTQLQNGRELPQENLISYSLMLQNVLSWSLAKNSSAFDGNRKSALSKHSQESNNSPETQRSTGSQNTPSHVEIVQNGIHSHNNSYEYIKDVPVELFAISNPEMDKKKSEPNQ